MLIDDVVGWVNRNRMMLFGWYKKHQYSPIPDLEDLFQDAHMAAIIAVHCMNAKGLDGWDSFYATFWHTLKKIRFTPRNLEIPFTMLGNSADDEEDPFLRVVNSALCADTRESADYSLEREWDQIKDSIPESHRKIAEAAAGLHIFGACTYRANAQHLGIGKSTMADKVSEVVTMIEAVLLEKGLIGEPTEESVDAGEDTDA